MKTKAPTTNIPSQRTMLGLMFKKFLHTKLGAEVAYRAGVSGFNRIDSYITRANGSIEHLSPTYNSRVDKGAQLIAALLTNNAFSITSPTYPLYIALSTSSLTPAKGDTTLSGETSASGMGRAIGTAGTYTAPASLDAAASYILSKTFTASGSATIVSAAIFDAVSTGNMLVEANLTSSATLASGDQLTINWTINF